MINRLTALAIVCFAMVTTHGQDFSIPEADSIRHVLNKSMPDTKRLDLLFQLAEFYISRPGEYKQDLEAAADYLKKAELVNTRLKSEDIRGFHLLIASMLANKKKQEKEGKEMVEKAISIIKAGSNKYYLAKAYFILSDYYHYTDRTEIGEKIRLVEVAVQFFAQSGHVAAHANSLKHLADLYEINEQRSKVLDNLNLSLKLYKSIKHSRLSGLYVLYNRYYYIGGNYKLAMDYCLMALKDAETAGDSTMLYCQINNYMAITLVHLKERERATGYYKTALRIAEKYNDNTAVVLVVNNMVRNYIELKNPQVALELMKSIRKNLLVPTAGEGYILGSLCYASIYMELKDYTEAGIYCNQVLDLIKVQMPRAQVVNDFYHLLIRYYLESGQYAAARSYHHKIDSLSRKIGDPARIKDNYYLAFRLDTATRSYTSAITNLLQFQNLHDSLFDETSGRQMQELEVEYETEKNKNEIKIKNQDIVLLHQKNQLQQSNLERAGLIRNFTMAGVVLLLVIISLLYYQFRNKQKSSDLITTKNELLQHLVTEKEWLLKELHHRVKNNLQVVMSLLNTQSAYTDNQAALTAIHDSQRRVHAMSLIHRKLYNSDNVSSIDMSLYIHDLVSYLQDSFNTGQRIRFESDIEPFDLDVSRAVPLGLILNEAITNSIKYAFPGDREGLINISLLKTSVTHSLLCISDNGIGMPATVSNKNPGSLGMNLMKGLSEDLDGNFSIENCNGTRIEISFVHEPNALRTET